jgi:hypothetical protein
LPAGTVAQLVDGKLRVVSKPSAANQNVAAKQGALRTLNYVATRLEQHLPNVKTGGAMGARGLLSKVTDSQDAMRLNNLREQLSTELRTIFRIPGEGALSDREQAQYGLQLPDIRYDYKQNLAILNDIRQRAGLRIQQPEAAAEPAAAAGGYEVGQEYEDAEGNSAVYLGNYDGEDRWEPL